MVVTLPQPLSDAAASLARRAGISLEQLYIRAVEEYVHAHSRSERYEGVTEALNRIYAREPSELDPGIARLQSAALDKDDW